MSDSEREPFQPKADDAPVTWRDLREAVGAIVALEMSIVERQNGVLSKDPEKIKTTAASLDKAVDRIEKTYRVGDLRIER